MEVFREISWVPEQAADQTFLLKKEKKKIFMFGAFFIPHF